MRQRFVRLFSRSRCRFCGDGMRPKDATNGACPECTEATWEWLREMKVELVWPMK